MTREEMRYKLNELRMMLNDGEHGEEQGILVNIISEMDKWEEIAENKGEWIPVTERLPEKNIACLVAVGKLNLTQIAMYSDLMGTISHRIFYQGDVGYDSFVDITEYVNAWQPLPKPYKGGDA